ncbi:hypothetical protein HIM_03203 [Hirsutella minnesotensis 3608]|nr:hypothetical protein HIM_03203 [Hirsutella minnesotensis 3608]
MASPQDNGDVQLAAVPPNESRESGGAHHPIFSHEDTLATPRILSDNQLEFSKPESPEKDDLSIMSPSQEAPWQYTDVAPAVAQEPAPIIHAVPTSTPFSGPVQEPTSVTASPWQDHSAICSIPSSPNAIKHSAENSPRIEAANAETVAPPSTLQAPQTTQTSNTKEPAESSDLAQCHSIETSNDPIDVTAPSLPVNNIEYEYDEADGHRILRLKPTSSQWGDFPAVLAFAKTLGVQDDGCFKVSIPDGLHDPLPDKPTKTVPANAYKAKQIKKTTFWQVSTVPSDGEFSSSKTGPDFSESVDCALKNLKRLFRSNKDRQMRGVRYRVDVPAWTPRQRLEAGVPEQSPIHPLKGDKLDFTKAVIPGIHTPYVYESGPHFGATFQIHAEDFRLASLNHLYKGRKIWIVIPATAVDIAEKALGRGEGCSQFMRHRCEFFFPDKLDKLGIPYRFVDQRPGETIVILPDAYHEGFSTGYTIAEAKNYADANWSTDSYQPCQASCRLITAIPAALMRPLTEGEVRLDLCAAYGDDGRLLPLETLQKRAAGDISGEPCAGEQLGAEKAEDVAGMTLDDRGGKRIKI